MTRWNRLSYVPSAARRAVIRGDRLRDSMRRANFFQVIVNTNRQNVSRDSEVFRFGAITGSRRLQP